MRRTQLAADVTHGTNTSPAASGRGLSSTRLVVDIRSSNWSTLLPSEIETQGGLDGCVEAEMEINNKDFKTNWCVITEPRTCRVGDFGDEAEGLVVNRRKVGGKY